MRILDCNNYYGSEIAVPPLLPPPKFSGNTPLSFLIDNLSPVIDNYFGNCMSQNLNFNNSANNLLTFIVENNIHLNKYHNIEYSQQWNKNCIVQYIWIIEYLDFHGIFVESSMQCSVWKISLKGIKLLFGHLFCKTYVTQYTADRESNFIIKLFSFSHTMWQYPAILSYEQPSHIFKNYFEWLE